MKKDLEERETSAKNSSDDDVSSQQKALATLTEQTEVTKAEESQLQVKLTEKKAEVENLSEKLKSLKSRQGLDDQFQAIENLPWVHQALQQQLFLPSVNF